MEALREIDDTFCIAVLGDFLGDASATPDGSAANWAPRRATPDTVMNLLGFRPSLRIGGLADRSVEVGFSDLESFQPDALFQRLDLFSPYRQAREAAREGRTLAEGYIERAGPEVEPVPDPAEDPEGEGRTGPPQREPTGGSLLDAILDEAQPEMKDSLPRTREELSAFVRAAVRPHLVRPDVEGPARVAQVDEAAGVVLSALLHLPAFQELESIWRSLVVLLSRADPSGKVRIYAANVPRRELEKDLRNSDGPAGSRLHTLLGSPDLGAKGRRWSLVVGAYSFGFDPEDVALLARIAAAARAADVPWISSFQPSVDRREAELQPDDASASWEAFRHQPDAAWLGLTYPRFLVREPFTPSGRPSRGLSYRETVASPDSLLWGHGGFLCAALFAQGHAAEGRGFRPEQWLDLEGMPQAAGSAGDGAPAVATEQALGLGDADGFLASGVIPLVPFPARAAIRLGGIRSVAAGGVPLAAWWRRT